MHKWERNDITHQIRQIGEELLQIDKVVWILYAPPSACEAQAYCIF